MLGPTDGRTRVVGCKVGRIRSEMEALSLSTRHRNVYSRSAVVTGLLTEATKFKFILDWSTFSVCLHIL